MLPGLSVGSGLMSEKRLTIERVATPSAQTGDASSYTFSSVNLGTASADRYVVVVYASQRNPFQTFSSGTIAGVTAINGTQAGGTTSAYTGRMEAYVPTGTSGDIVINMSGTVNHMGIIVYVIRGSTTITRQDAEYGTATGTSTLSEGVNFSRGGIVLGSCGSDSGDYASWTGITTDHSYLVEGTHYAYAFIQEKNVDGSEVNYDLVTSSSSNRPSLYTTYRP